MGRIEKTVFISYRRTNLPWALFIWQNLTMHGYDVFFDYQSIDSGGFEKVILENIKARAHFIIILTPSALERCKNPGDWLRREIETAIDEKRNIIPLMVEGFDFGSSLVKEALTGKLAVLSGINALRIPDDFAIEAMDRLRDRFLKVALSDVSLPALPSEAQERTDAEKIAANEAPPVSEEQLSAQTWFERGYVFQSDDNFDEALRCYSEAIRLDPQLNAAHNNLGVLLKDLKRYEEAEATYRKAIELNPDDATAYSNLGILLKNLKRYEEAEAAYRKAIQLKPSFDSFHINLGQLYLEQGKEQKAIHVLTEAIQINPESARCFRQRGLIYQTNGNLESALEDYRKAIELQADYGIVRMSLFGLLKKMGKDEEAREHEALAREFAKTESEYNRACFESLCENADEAINLLKIALEKEQSSKDWAQQDPDFENIRNNPRFKELIGK